LLEATVQKIVRAEQLGEAAKKAFQRNDPNIHERHPGSEPLGNDQIYGLFTFAV
jgi:hypothetical protein